MKKPKAEKVFQKGALFASAATALASTPGCGIQGEALSISAWIVGSMIAFVFLVAGLIANTVFLWKKNTVMIRKEDSNKKAVASVSAMRQPAKTQTFDSYLSSEAAAPERQADIKTEEGRITRHLKAVDPKVVHCAAIRFVPMEQYAPQEPAQKNMREFIATANNKNIDERHKERQAERRNGSMSALKEQTDALWASLNSLKFHVMNKEPIAIEERMNCLLQLVQIEQHEFMIAYSAGNNVGAIEATIRMLANVEDFSDWAQHNKGNPILIMGVANITSKLKPLLESLGMRQEHGVYFYGGSQQRQGGSI